MKNILYGDHRQCNKGNKSKKMISKLYFQKQEKQSRQITEKKNEVSKKCQIFAIQHFYA